MVYTFIMVTYFRVEMNLLYKMYKQHRYEFQIHIKRMSLLFFFTVFSNYLFLSTMIYFLYFGMCLTDADKDEGAAWIDFEDPKGVCAYVFSGLVDMTEKSTSSIPLSLIVFDFVILMPIIVFMIFDKPHDCFVCLGKDPDRTYSIF